MFHYGDSDSVQACIRSIVESAADGIIVVSSAGVIEQINPAAEKLFGYSAQEVIGQRLTILMPEPFRSNHDTFLANFLRTGIKKMISRSKELTGMRRDGTTFPMELVVSDMHVGNEYKFTGIVRDITDRKNSEARIRSIVETAVDGIIVINSFGLVEQFNLAAERLFGYGSHEVIGHNIKMLMPDPFRSQHDQYLKSFLDTGVKKIIGIGREVIGLRKDGSTFPMELAVSEMRIGDEVKFTGIVRDITERKMSEARIRSIVETAVDGIIVIDSTGLIEQYNPSAERMFGHTTKETIGHNISMLMPQPYKSQHDQYLKNFLATGVKKVIGIGREVVGLRKDGSTFPMELAISEMRIGNEVKFTGIVRDITERKRSDARLSSIVETAVDSIIVIDSEGIIEQFNPAAERMFGYPTDMVLGKNINMLMPEPFKSQHGQYISNFLNTGVKKVIGNGREVYGLRRNGSIFAMELVVSEMRIGDERKFTGIVRDISERKKAEEALRQSEQKFELLVSSVTDYAIFMLDKNGLVSSWNTGAEVTLGYTAPEIIGKSFSLFYPDDVIDRAGSVLDIASKEGRFEGEGWTSRKDGSSFWADVTVTPIKDCSGSVLGFSVVTRDMTEKQRLKEEEQTRKSSAVARSLIQASRDPLLTIDTYGNILDANSATEVVTGVPGNQLIGSDFSGYFTEPEKAMEAYQCALVLGYASNYTLAMKHVSGTTTDVLYSASVYKNEKGIIQGVFVAARDISALRKAEAEMNNALQAAEAASRAKAAFLANMSHEIRTPMNAIYGLTELLLYTDIDAHQRDYLQTIYSSCKLLRTVIDDILDFSKIESGKLALDEHEFDLRGIVEETIDLMAVKAMEKQLEIGYIIDQGTPERIISDGSRIRQVLTNYVSNAVKFTPVGEVMVKVSSIQTGENSRIFHFSVADTGIGIPSNRIEKLFEPFTQVDVSNTRIYGGTGLGLAISKRLTSLLGGKVWVDSTEGKGSTFHFTLTAKVAPPKIEALNSSSTTITAGSSISVPPNLSVVVVDSTGVTHTVLRSLLVSYDISVINVKPEHAPLYIAHSKSVAIVFINDSSGGLVDIADKIKRACPSNPLVCVAWPSPNYDDDTEKTRLFTAMLPKPIKKQTLLCLLSNMFSHASTPQRSVALMMPMLDGSGSGIGDKDTGSLTILLAEDNSVNQKVALRMLEKLGYTADIANNGNEAIAAVEKKNYDLILMDIQMPEKDGVEATQYICEKWPHDKRPCIIGLTANALQSERQRCLNAGMSDYLVKPVGMQVLSQTLSSIKKAVQTK